GFAAHVSMAEPVCPKLLGALEAAARAEDIPCRRGGTYLAMEGPQFSTLAESRLYRAWGCDVIGMTGMPEAKLAREAELPYACVGMVTDYDCWHEAHGAVEVSSILAVMTANAGRARRLVQHLASMLPAERTPSPIDTCLDFAIVTAPEARDPEMAAR